MPNRDIIDLILLVLILIGTIWGYARGIVSIFFLFFSIIGAFFSSTLFGSYLSIFISKYIHNEKAVIIVIIKNEPVRAPQRYNKSFFY